MTNSSERLLDSDMKLGRLRSSYLVAIKQKEDEIRAIEKKLALLDEVARDAKQESNARTELPRPAHET